VTRAANVHGGGGEGSGAPAGPGTGGEARGRGDVAVIGGGPAGLAAAWTLASAGATVTLYERSPVAGGWLRTEAVDGVTADVGAQLLASYYVETLRVAREAGFAELLVRSPGRDALWRGGRAHGITYGSVASMAASGALPTGLKLRLATKYVAFLRRHAGELDPNEPVRAAALDGESIAAWGRREVGEDFVELMAYPQLAAYYGCTPEETSAALYHALAFAGMDVGLVAARGGMGALAAAWTRGLEAAGCGVRIGVDVVAVRVAGTGVEVEWDGGYARHDAAVLAVPAPIAARVGGFGGALGEWLAGARRTPAASMALVVDGPIPGDYFGLSVPRGGSPGERVVAVCVQGRKGAGLGEGGREALVVYPAPAIVSRVLDAEPERAFELLVPDLERIYPGVARRVVRGRLFRFPDGGSLFYPGYLRHLRRFDPAWLPPRLALAGDYLVAPTVEGAVRSGRKAAAAILRGIGG